MRIIQFVAFGGLVCAGPALAQTTPAPAGATPQTGGEVAGATPAAPLSVGSQIHDPAGQPVGSVVSIADAAVVVDTGAHKVSLPPRAIGPDGKGGFVCSLTKAQLDGAYDQQVAKTDAMLQQKLVPGTHVTTFYGAAEAGTVRAVDDTYVTLATPKGEVKLPRTVFALNATGDLVVRMTADDFAKALSSVKPAP